MAYIDWWNRTGPVTLGERFGLNEISIARNTLSPTKSYTEDRIDMNSGGIVPLSTEEAKIFKLLQEGKLPTHHAGAAEQMAKRFSEPWNKLTNVERQNFKHQLFPFYSKVVSETEGMLSREHLAKLLTEKLEVPISRFQVVGRGGTRAGASKRTEFAIKLEELLQPTKYTQKTSFYKIPTASDIRELKKLVKITPSGSLKNLTVENMVTLNNKFGSLYKKGKLPSWEVVLRALPDMSPSQAGNATIRLAQLYNGKEFKLFSNLNADVRKTFEKIKTDEKTAEKIFKLAQGGKFNNPYYAAMYRISLDTIDEKLGNQRGTFANLKVQARKLLVKNKLPIYDAKATNPYGFNINEIVGVSGSAKSKAVEFSQFIDVMEGNLNQNTLTAYQSKLSQARVRIEANPALFESEAKYINKMASHLEKEHGVKLARLRPSETVSKYYSPKRLGELKEQGLDIEKASKRAGYTFQFPKGTQTIKEFLKNPKIQNLLRNIKNLKGLPRANAIKLLLTFGVGIKLLNDYGISSAEAAEAKTLKPDDKQVEAGTSLGEYILGGAGIGVGTAASKYGAWNVAKALGRWGIKYPLAASAIPFWQVGGAFLETLKAAAEKRFPDYKLDDWQTWMHGAFWDWGIKTFGLDKMSEAFGGSFNTLSKMDKARVVRNVAARGLMSPKTIKFISSKIAWPVTGALAYQDLEKWAKENVRKTPLTELEQKDIQKRKAAVPTMIGITEQAYKRAKQEGITYEDALKKIKQELADKETPLNIPGIEFKEKDELAMGGIASLIK